MTLVRYTKPANWSALSALCFALFLFASLPAAATTVPDDFQDNLIINGLNQPVGFTFLPDGRLLFIEQVNARIRLLVNGAIGANDPLVTVPSVNTSGNERGLLGIDVDSGWPGRPYIYVYYSHSGTNTNYLSMFTVTGDLSDPNSDNLAISAASRYDLLTDIPDNAYNHNGGTCRFGTDDMLYVSMGDDATQCTAQETDDLRGMILRLDVSTMPGSGSGPPPKADITPSDNPFTGDANTNLVFCYGLRNPFRFNVDRVSGDLYIADVGLGSYEEVDLATGGENFGWPFREGPMIREPGGCDEPGGPGGTDYDDPIHYYNRSGFSASVVSATYYRPENFPADSSFPPEYNGNCFYVEYYQGWMVRIKDTGSSWEVADPVAGQPSNDHWATGLDGASDFLVGPDGAIYYCRQYGDGGGGSGGSLRRIEYNGPAVPTPRIVTGPGPAEFNDCLVRVWNPDSTGAALDEWSAYGVPKYGVNVATGDTNNDGLAEVLTGAGPGAVFGPHVRGFDFAGTPVSGINFLAYGTNKFGVNVCAGDVDGDGNDEIITGAGPGAVFGPHVRGWNVDGGTPVSMAGINYFAYGTPKWGVNVAAGDIDGDGYDEIVTGAGPGAVYGPHVRGWNVDGGAATAIPGVSFLAYGTNKFGVNATCGDFDGDGIDEIITGAGPGVVFGSHVRGWNYDGGTLTPVGGINFFAYSGSLYGARVATLDLDGDGYDELLTVPGPDPDWPAQVKAWNVDGGAATAIGSIDFDAYADGAFLHGGSVTGGIGY